MKRSNLISRCLFFLCLLVAITSAGAEKMKASEKAREHFAAGLAHIDDPSGPKYEEAYREFRAAYAETPSYEIAVNVGYTAFFLERDAEAIEMYELYLAKADDKDIPSKKRAQMLKDIQSLRAGLVHVSVRVTPNLATLIDERFPSKGTTVVNRYPIESETIQLGIHPGNHKFTIVAEGFEPQSWDFEAEPGTSHSHEFNLQPTSKTVATPANATVAQPTPANESAPPISPAEKQLSPWFYASAVATGVFAAGAVGMGFGATSTKGKFESANDGTQYSRAEELRRDMKTYALISDVCLGAAALSAGASIYFYVKRDSKSPAKVETAKWEISPTLGIATAGLAISGSY